MTLAESCPPDVRKLVEEIWGTAVAGYLFTPPASAPKEHLAALRHIDRRLREGGFLPTTVKFVDKP